MVDVFSRLPVEISWDILASPVLTPRDLARTSQVDRRCRALVEDEGVWRRIGVRSLPPALGRRCSAASAKTVSLAEVQSAWADADETHILSSARSWREYAVLVWLLQEEWTEGQMKLVHLLLRTGRSFPRGMWPDAMDQNLAMIRPLDQASTFDVSTELLVLPRARMVLSQGNQWDWWPVHLDTQDVPMGVPPSGVNLGNPTRILSRAAAGPYLVVAYVLSMWIHARPTSCTQAVKVYKFSGGTYHFHSELDFVNSPIEQNESVIVFLHGGDEVVLVHTSMTLTFWSAETGTFRRKAALPIQEDRRLIRASLSTETGTLCVGVPMSIQRLCAFNMQGEHLWNLSDHLRPMPMYNLCSSNPGAPLQVVQHEEDDSGPLRYRPGVFKLAGTMLVVATERELVILPSDMGAGLRACYRLDELVKDAGVSTAGDLSLDALGTRAVLCNTPGVVVVLDWAQALATNDPTALQAYTVNPLFPSLPPSPPPNSCPTPSNGSDDGYAQAQSEVLAFVRGELGRDLPRVFRVSITPTSVYFHMHHWATYGDRSFAVCWDVVGPALRKYDPKRYGSYIAHKLVLGPATLLRHGVY